MDIRVLVLPAMLLLFADAALAQGPRGRGGFDPSEFLSRLDTNGNGMIDPEEAEGRAGFFLRRIAETNPDIDFSRPVPLERIQQAFAQARERREAERGSDEGRDRGSRDGSSDGSSQGRSSPTKPEEPMVPGFGLASALPVVPGFGLMVDASGMVQVTEDDRNSARRLIARYDANNDGVLDAEELQRLRSRNEIAQYDRNRDGLLSVEELAVRYAQRRAEREQSESGQAASSSRTASSRPSGSSAPSSSSSSGQEDRSRGGWGGWGGRRDEDRGSGGGDRSSSREGSRTGASPAAAAKTERGIAYRVVSAEQRLAKTGVPSWFRELDKNGDGQVSMDEYSSNWTETLLAEFAQFDLNGDGIITPEECIKAVKDGAARAGSSSLASLGSRSRGGGYSRPSTSSYPSRAQPSTSAPANRESRPSDSDDADDADEMVDAAEPGEEGMDAETDDAADEDQEADDMPADAAPTDATAGAPSGEQVENDPDFPRYLDYAQGRIKDLDDNGDGVLQPSEWANSTKPIEAADANGDGIITPRELAIFYMTQ